MSLEQRNNVEQWGSQERAIPARRANEDYDAYYRRICREWSNSAKEAMVTHQKWCEQMKWAKGGLQQKHYRQRILVVMTQLFESSFLKDDYIDTGLPREDCEQAISELKRMGYDELCLLEGADWKFALLSQFLFKENTDFMLVDETKAGFYLNNVREEISETAAEAFFRFATFAKLVQQDMQQLQDGDNPTADDDFGRYRTMILEAIRPLSKHVDKKYQECYGQLLDKIFQIGPLQEKLKIPAPNGFNGGYNMKLTCNIVGLLCKINVYTLSQHKADKLIYTDKVHYSYFNGYASNDHGIGLSREDIQAIKELVKSLV